MRIVHVSDCYLPRVGGIERQIHDLAVRQRQRGHDVQIVTSVAGASAAGVDGIAVHRPRPRSGGDPTTIRYLWSTWGRRHVLDSDADVVHVHASTISPLAFATAAATARLGIPTVVTVHSLWAYASPLFRWADRALRWREWPLTWSAVSSVAAEPLRRILGPDVPVAVLPNGVDAEAWRTPPTAHDAKHVVITSVGRLAARKRPRQLLRILRHARAAIPADIQIEAVLAGDGPLAPSLRRYLARHDMTQWVRLVGAACPEEIRRIHARADLYVAPAVLESFGIAALEARCAGLPVVAYRGTGIADFVLDGVEGLLVADDDDMMQRIVALATSPETLGRMRLHNATTDPRVSWADTIRLSDSLYARAIGPTASTRPTTVDRAAMA
ncbi:MAG TPA: glycosyltransferase family 4 protein [Micromonosporaceae bacterium]